MTIKLPVFLIFAAIVCQPVAAQEFILQGAWKLSFQDEKEFSRKDLNDSAWADLTELKWSDDHKTTANRTLWIRKRIMVPSSLKAEFEKTGLLALSMGKILQSDETFLNGNRIGATGSGDTYRNYLISKNDILWDAENQFAIRVKHWGSFRVSIVPKFVAASPAHFFAYSAGIKSGDAKAPVQKKALSYQLTVSNSSPKTVEGIVRAAFYNFKGDKIHSAQQNVSLTQGKNTVSFPYTSSFPFVKIIYSLSVPVYGYNTQWNAEHGYEYVIYKKTLPVVAYRGSQKFFPAELSKQSIGGWLGEKLTVNTEKRLYKVDEEALLAGFINRPGSHSWIGEHIGKFLEAGCNAYDYKNDPQLKSQIDRSAHQLIAAQLPDGYLGTYEMDSHWTSWDVWSHRYDLMGLLRYYELSGFRPALASCKKIGDLLMQTFGPDKGQKDIVRAGGHVGMAATCILESMAELYRFTGEKKYLDFCYFIVESFDNPRGPRIISTLDTLGRVDKVANAKAYEMLSNLLGVVKLYRLTADDRFLKPVLAAWQDIAANRLYITGTASSFEHFQEDQVLPASQKDNMGEGCVTTTWLQFSYQLFCITGEAKYLDELERSVYNHLTGAESPQTGCVSYYTPLQGQKPYGCSITCCMSSVPRGIAMIPLFVSGKWQGSPSINFYQPGTFTTTATDGKNANTAVRLTTVSDDLKGENFAITVAATSESVFTLMLRRPYWSKNFKVAINGIPYSFSSDDFISVKRLWRKGDIISVHFSVPVVAHDGGKSYPGMIALQRGPQVLTYDQALNNLTAGEVSFSYENLILQDGAALLPAGWIGKQAYTIVNAQKSNREKVILVPFADASQTGGSISTWMKKQ